MDLEEHPASAGGISDLSFRGLKIELKAEKARRLTINDCRDFVSQTASYGVSSGMRIGMLCVVDSSPKDAPSFPVEDGLDLLETTDPGGVGVVTLLVQGNLARPSDLSRR